VLVKETERSRPLVVIGCDLPMSVRLSLTPSWFLQILRTNESVSIGVFTTLFPLVGTLTLLNLKLVLLEFGSPLISESVTSNTVSTDQVLSTAVQSETILHLSEVVCATLKNQEFIDSIIPLHY
jgi:hypothetical protein